MCMNISWISESTRCQLAFIYSLRPARRVQTCSLSHTSSTDSLKERQVGQRFSVCVAVATGSRVVPRIDRVHDFISPSSTTTTTSSHHCRRLLPLVPVPLLLCLCINVASKARENGFHYPTLPPHNSGRQHALPCRKFQCSYIRTARQEKEASITH